MQPRSHHVPPRFLSFSMIFFFFNDTATTEIYTLSLHDALPISPRARIDGADRLGLAHRPHERADPRVGDRKSTRLNSSHDQISYAVFCLKKKKNHFVFDGHDPRSQFNDRRFRAEGPSHRDEIAP